MARVLVDKGVLHLDRYFDYAVPEELDAVAQPGVRVRVRFGAGSRNVREGRREGGGLIDGFIVERCAESEYSGPLAALAQVVSPEQVLDSGLLELARAVADRYAGSPRRCAPPGGAAPGTRAPSPGRPPPLRRHRPPRTRGPGGGTGTGPSSSGRWPRAGRPARCGPRCPGRSGPRRSPAPYRPRLPRAAAARRRTTGRPAARVDAALTALLGEGQHAVLTAVAGQERRYREWLSVRRGEVRAVVGTRAAMFAPVRDLGLVVVWDDGDSNHSEDRAPFPHVREVLELRATRDKCGFLLGSWSCTVEAAQLVESGWEAPLVAGREQVRGAAPLVRTVGDGDLARDEAARAARLPTLAWQVVREGLKHGPVLVQVPRRGYVPPARRASGAGSPRGAAGAPVRWRRRRAPARSAVRLVRGGGGRLALRCLWRLPAAGPGRGRAADGRGVGPGLSRGAGTDIGARAGARTWCRERPRWW